MKSQQRKPLKMPLTSATPDSPGVANSITKTDSNSEEKDKQNEPLNKQKGRFVEGKASLAATSLLNVKTIDIEKKVEKMEHEAGRKLVRPDLIKNSWVVLVVLLSVYVLIFILAAAYYDACVTKSANEIYNTTMAVVCTKSNFPPLELENCIERAGSRVIARHKEAYTSIVIAAVVTTIAGLIAFFVRVGSRNRDNNDQE